MKLYFDTSVLVAFAVKGHVHHAAAYEALAQAVRGKHQAYVSSHGMAECYAVLTRTPFNPPVYPSEVWQILAESLLPTFTLVSLTGKDIKKSCTKAPCRAGLVGGSTTCCICAVRKKNTARASTPLTSGISARWLRAV